MARIVEWSKEQEEEWIKWVASRPEIVRDLCKRFPPYNLYRLKNPEGSGSRVVMHSYSEDGTMTVDVLGKYNLIMFEKQLFGIKPEDLEECDIPDAAVLTNKDEISEPLRTAYVGAKRKETRRL